MIGCCCILDPRTQTALVPHKLLRQTWLSSAAHQARSLVSEGFLSTCVSSPQLLAIAWLQRQVCFWVKGVHKPDRVGEFSAPGSASRKLETAKYLQVRRGVPKLVFHLARGFLPAIPVIVFVAARADKVIDFSEARPADLHRSDCMHSHTVIDIKLGHFKLCS